jgi:hypothetical protein
MFVTQLDDYYNENAPVLEGYASKWQGLKNAFDKSEDILVPLCKQHSAVWDSAPVGITFIHEKSHHDGVEGPFFRYSPGEGYGAADCKPFHDKLNAIRIKMKPHADKVKALKPELDKLASLHRPIYSKMETMIQQRIRNLIYILQESEGIETRSDADGKFTLELDRGTEYVITGYGKREILKSTETYNWIVPLKTPKTDKEIEVFLSNSELTNRIFGDDDVAMKYQSLLGKGKLGKTHFGILETRPLKPPRAY